MTASPDLQLTDRLAAIQSRIRSAAEKSGRAPSDVRLLAATKTVPVATILESARIGITEIGENRVQEAASKQSGLQNVPLTHHLIGQLQTNKARRAVELFDVIQSVDRLRLAEAISRAAGELGKRQRCLIEVKVSDDDAKVGVSVEDADGLIEAVASMPNIELNGVMAIAPFEAKEAETEKAFNRAAQIFKRNLIRFGKAPILSMGMSDDFETAIAQGSTMIRVGRALFGERKPEDA